MMGLCILYLTLCEARLNVAPSSLSRMSREDAFYDDEDHHTVTHDTTLCSSRNGLDADCPAVAFSANLSDSGTSSLLQYHLQLPHQDPFNYMLQILGQWRTDLNYKKESLRNNPFGSSITPHEVASLEEKVLNLDVYVEAVRIVEHQMDRVMRSNDVNLPTATVHYLRGLREHFLRTGHDLSRGQIKGAGDTGPAVLLHKEYGAYVHSVMKRRGENVKKRLDQTRSPDLLTHLQKRMDDAKRAEVFEQLQSMLVDKFTGAMPRGQTVSFDQLDTWQARGAMRVLIYLMKYSPETFYLIDDAILDNHQFCRKYDVECYDCMRYCNGKFGLSSKTVDGVMRCPKLPKGSSPHHFCDRMRKEHFGFPADWPSNYWTKN